MNMLEIYPLNQGEKPMKQTRQTAGYQRANSGAKNPHVPNFVSCVIFEEDAFEAAKETPSLYVYLRTVHAMIRDRLEKGTHTLKLKGLPLIDLVYDKWMEDARPMRVIDEVMEVL